MSARLFHVSEESGLHEFHPRPAPDPSSGLLNESVVWAIDEPHLPNYLFPRDCPRVCFALGRDTTADDNRRFFHGTHAARIIVVEDDWHDRILACSLFLYELPRNAFKLHDADAGYWVTRDSVTSAGIVEIRDVVAELLDRSVDLRFAPSLWPIWDAVARSSLSFSAIRMRSAQPRHHD